MLLAALLNNASRASLAFVATIAWVCGPVLDFFLLLLRLLPDEGHDGLEGSVSFGHLLVMASALLGISGLDVLAHQEMDFEALPLLQRFTEKSTVFLQELPVPGVVLGGPKVALASAVSGGGPSPRTL